MTIFKLVRFVIRIRQIRLEVSFTFVSILFLDNEDITLSRLNAIDILLILATLGIT